MSGCSPLDVADTGIAGSKIRFFGAQAFVNVLGAITFLSVYPSSSLMITTFWGLSLLILLFAVAFPHRPFYQNRHAHRWVKYVFQPTSVRDFVPVFVNADDEVDVRFFVTLFGYHMPGISFSANPYSAERRERMITHLNEFSKFKTDWTCKLCFRVQN